MFQLESMDYGSVLKSGDVCFYDYTDFTHAAVSLHNSPLEFCFEFLSSELEFSQRTIGEELFHTVTFTASNSSDTFTFTFDNDQELEQFCVFYGLVL